MKRQDIIDKQKKFLFSCVANYYDEPLVVDHAKGAYVYDSEGKEYLDFFGGIVTISVGHCNEKVIGAIEKQSAKLQHISTLYPNEPHVRLAEKLAQITPGKLQKSFFTNSGTEANETAVLLAELHTQCQDVIALRHGYSGRTHLAMSLTAHAAWRLTPASTPGIHHIPNAYCYRCPFGLTYPSCDLKCAKDLEEAIQTVTSGRLAAFVAEPIQGIGGCVTPPKEYFSANGTPIGATIATAEIADSMKGMSISTFGGNPVASAAALATIEVVEEENLVENARVMGQRLRDGLEAFKKKYPVIGDVRGMGLMQGIELVGENKQPQPEATRRLFEATKANGLLIGKGGLAGNVVRITPPLNVTADQIDQALKMLDRSFGRMGL